MCEPSSDSGPPERPRRWWLPRPETWILLVGLSCTVWSKWFALRHLGVTGLPGQLLRVALPDAVFFSAVALAIRCLHLLKPSRWTARAALVIAAIVSVWSILNAGMLIQEGVQLQLGVVKLFLRDAAQLWPLVKPHIKAHQTHMVGLLAVVLASLTLLVWFLIRPGRIVPARRYHARRAGIVALGTAVLVLLSYVAPAGTAASSDVAVLGFSSHQYALASALTGTFENHNRNLTSRQIPRAGERRIVAPNPPPHPFPNIVLVLLESISRSATSLDDAKRATTPFLARLAEQGADFRRSRVVVSHTTKALWAVLTGIAPVAEDNYVEAVLADRPYEALPGLLGRSGYRSAFFQMSKGSFECAPGLSSNLGFDWVWFRENLRDPSAHLGYLSGDDFRMIDPAFDWATEQGRPFLLLMVTSVSHDPFTVPEWFGNIQGSRRDKYLHSVRFTDRFLEAVDKALTDRGLADNTILCVVGDHGTSFRPSVGQGGGRWWPYEEVIHVPWVMRWPKGLPAGRKIDAPCSHLDVTPTILALIGMDISRAGFEGVDALSSSAGGSRRFYFSSWYGGSPMGFVEGVRKVVYLPYIHKAFEYDLSSDPGERRPREMPPDQIDRIRREVLGWQQESRVAFPPRRFRQRLLYSHWQTFCPGNEPRAYYVP